MNKRNLIKRIIANVVDFDMHNLFPPATFMENLEDAASGSYIIQPKRILRERSYGNQPLVIVPKYEGDFLEKLQKQPLEGKSVENVVNVYSADGDNLWDFSMPSEWLKHQEHPFPRNLVDLFYEVNRPGEQVGEKVLDEFNDRSWDPDDAPEISEDKWLRRGPIPGKSVKVPFHTAKRIVFSFLSRIHRGNNPDINVIIASFLLKNSPVEVIMDFDYKKEAVLLNELEETKIESKTKGIHSPDVGGVTIRVLRSEPKMGRWIFRTQSGTRPPAADRWPYTTVFQFVPQLNKKEVNKLHVRVSCTCPSWLYWGAQYNATMKDYRYGPIRPKFAPPVIRDPNGRFLVCKHILACIPWLVGTGEVGKFTEDGFTLHRVDVSERVKKKIEKVPKFEIEKRAPKEKLKIPVEYLKIGGRPEIKKIVSKWERTTPRQRKKIIMGLEDPKELVYFAHRFPETSTHFIAERLRQLKEVKDTEIKKKAEEGMKEVDKIETKIEAELPSMPNKLKKYEQSSHVQETILELKKPADIRVKRSRLKEEQDVNALAYMAIALYREDFLEGVDAVLYRLNAIAKDESIKKSVRKKADEWLRYIY